MGNFNTMKTVILLGVAISIVIIGYGLYLYVNVKSTMESIHKPIELGTTPIVSNNNLPSKTEDYTPHSSEYPQPITLLLLGIDTWDSVGRADTILILTINPTKKTIKMLSIPRDTYTEIIDLGFSDKINHSYAFGGVEMTLATVQNLLDIPINYVVTINMEGFTELINILGGIEINNETAFSTEDYDYPAGKINLSGEEALDYVRMRKQDPLGDFGRQIRQRLVIESLLYEATSLNMVLQAPSILKSIRNNVETNITYDEMKEFPEIYKPTLNNIEQLHFTAGEGRLENGIWYYFFEENELKQIQEELKESLTINEEES